MSRKNILFSLIIFDILYIGITLSPLLTKEIKDISYSDFRLVIGPFLSTVAILISYIQLKKEKRTSNSSIPNNS